jgi:2'-5' RNA ligase
MLQTIADDIWGQPCLAYHVQPHLDPETQDAFERFQQDIAARWPDPLHLCPKDGLHVTIYALIPVKVDFDKEAYWRHIAEPCRALLDDLCSGHEAIELHFNRLKVTDVAIIATATETTGIIGRIRDRIADVIPPPPGREPLRYDLIHTTLARYRTASSVPASAVESIEDLPVSIRAPVTRIKMIRETLFPCLERDELASFPLR